jgi:subtilisin family serine protease
VIRAVAVAVAAVALSAAALPVAASPVGVHVAVVVQGPADAVRAVGGTVTADLPIVDGVAARVPADAVDDLEAQPGVRAVTPDSRVTVAGELTPTGDNNRTVNPVAVREVNADRLWDEGITGKGAVIALVDTGVHPDVADLHGRMVPVDKADVVGTRMNLLEDTAACVDFSGDGDCVDRYGHGTFMAGLMAGSGAASQGRYRGVAPDARILSLKIAAPDGSADVSKVLAAIQWVVLFREKYGIDVLNLSLGTDSRAPYWIDPLNLAVQRAWVSGVTVVVSAGNRGASSKGNPTISKPGDDPFVITVGAVDDRETPAIDDDRLPAFASTGPTAHGLTKPDVVAPGGRVVSLRAPNSWVENHTPVPNGIDAVYRRGSGTSMSAAVTSGVVALALEARPTWKPNRIKGALMENARKVAARDRNAVGAGLIDAWAVAHDVVTRDANGGAVSVVSDGSGTLDGSRGTTYVTGPCNPGQGPEQCTEQLTGEKTAQGETWDGDEFADQMTDPAGSSWYETQWAQGAMQGSSWYGSSWYGSSWYGSSWYGSSWYGSFESETSYGAAVEGSSWYGAWG